MKTLWLAGVLSLSIVSGMRGQNTPEPTPYSVAGRHANDNVWERTTYDQGPDGSIISHAHRYTEMATGLNFKNPDTGEWEASSEEIEQIPGGAAARHGQHTVTFASDLATFGAIDMETPDGQRLQSHLLGLGYFDRSSGQSVFIAEVTNSIGQLIATNQVWYENAFTGLKAGVRYTYTREGFEQDIILEEQPLAPEAYGLDSSTTVLQAFTEFISPPAPKISTNSPDGQLADETLAFGMMRIGRGRAFLMGDDSTDCPVCKEWTTLEGRQFLIEEVPMSQITAELQTLPQAQASLRASNSVVNVVSKKHLLPAQPLAKAGKEPMKLATIKPKLGFVIDYYSLNTSLSDYVFQTDQTYYLTGNVDLNGSVNTFEGAAVLKYASGVSLTVNTPVNWGGGPYRPVVMVAKDDNTVGEPISGSTGSPGTAYYAATALCYYGNNAHTPLNIEGVRILNAKSGIVINEQNNHTLSDVQIMNCSCGIATTNTEFYVHNALFAHVLTNFSGGSDDIAYVEHLTSSTAMWLNKDIGTTLYLTNCMLVAVTNLGNCSTQNVATLSSGTGVFQTVGGGSYYLATNSPYRNAGTTNIDPVALADVATKTTYPPIVYLDTNINVGTTFSPVVQRDNDVPDLGYHYDPLDYAFSGTAVNTNITFSPGTAVGWFCAGSDTYGLHLADKQIATFTGTEENPDYFVRASTVQEGRNGNWTASWAIIGVIGTADQNLQNVALSPELRMQFTTCSVLSWGEQHYRDMAGYLIVRAKDSRLVGGDNGGYILSCFFTNCLIEGMEGGQVAGWTSNQWIMRNCTWHEGILYFSRYHTPAMPISIRDCSFDQVTVSTAGDSFITNTNYSDFDYNAYTNSSNLFPVGCAHDQQSVTFNWQTGPLGTYYLPGGSALVDAGDVTADLVGLYHFTTQTTSHSLETNSIVDIGYHYLAVDDYGNPLDTDGDGTPDYLEDANGNGLVDSGETDWQNATDLGLKVIITRPKNNSFIP